MKDQPREVLETRRLRLEPVSARHAEGLYQAALASRTQLLPWMPWAAEITLEGNRQATAEAHRSWSAGEEYHFAVLEDDVVLGVAGLNLAGDRSAELHYWIRSDRTGRGYATEAARASWSGGPNDWVCVPSPSGPASRTVLAAASRRSLASATLARCPNRCRAASAASLQKATSGPPMV